MQSIISLFTPENNLFIASRELFQHLNISLSTSEDLPYMPQNILEELYKPENKTHQLIKYLYLIGLVGDQEDGLLVLAVELNTQKVTRTELSTLTRLINRYAKGMPVAVLFRYGNHIALANAERTEYKQAFREGEKIGKVSILKDIDTLNPHRGHLDILETLKIPAKIKTFKDLYKHWQEVFNVSTLNKKFYNELFTWYQWTISEEVGVTYPNDTQTDQDDRVQLEEQIIRLITRVLFVWFIKQKQLVPNELFEEDSLNQLLKDFNPTSLSEGTYYNAILQNLFFATLNKKVTERAFAKAKNTRDVKTLYRYEEMFNCSEEEVINLFAPIPFLNGGLFECLDKDKGNDGVRYHLDGFSRNDRRSPANGHYTHRAFVPNAVFFDKEKGLFPLLNRYHFTIEENTPNEIQVALDPELLGNVFENLLGAFNPETKESARKQSGSFYTPKEVVHYMVDESLKAYLKNHLPHIAYENIEALFEDTDLPMEWLEYPTNCQKVVDALESIKILDPACGSGAFPMGILNRMVYLLEKLDFNNKRSLYELKLHLIQNCIYGIDIQKIASQISKLRFFISLIVEQSETSDSSEDNYGIETLPNLETKFVTANTLIRLKLEEQSDTLTLFDNDDPELKKLKKELLDIRYNHFYAKTVAEKIKYRKDDEDKRNQIKKHIWDNLTKPNTEHIGIWEKEILRLQKELEKYKDEKWEEIQQSDLFGEVTLIKIDLNRTKRRDIEDRIRYLQGLIEKEYHKIAPKGLQEELNTLASWNPYEQNGEAKFFDPEWMFGISDGFDIIIGNPPYVQLQNNGGKLAKLYEGQGFKTFARTGDIYCLFYEKAYQLLKQGGICNFITSNKWMRAGYGQATRKFFLEHTNPLILIDFAGIKVFETATVDVNILLYVKEKTTFNTWGCTIKDNELKKLSLYVRQHGGKTTFSSDESWVILSEIEQRIKAKIEAIGTPLKEWNISINYGIKTGFNDAFIINGEKRAELIAQDPKSAEIIRPILRGRDIKRYGYEFADLYLLFIPWHFPLHQRTPEIKGASKEAEKAFENQYPAIYNHLLQYKEELSNRNKAETGIRYEWYALQRWGANYWEDFYKQKIVWKAVGRNLAFSILEEGKFVTAPASFITSENSLYYILGFLCSSFAKYFIYNNSDTTGAGDIMLNIQSLVKIPIPQPSINNQEEVENIISEIIEGKKENIDTILLENKLDEIINNILSLSPEEIDFIRSF